MFDEIKTFKVKVFDPFCIQKYLLIDVENFKLEYAKNITIGQDITTVISEREKLIRDINKLYRYTILWKELYEDISMIDPEEAVIEILFNNNDCHTYHFKGKFPDNWSTFIEAVGDVLK